MGYIYYELNLSSNCVGMAPQTLPGGIFAPAMLPGGMGIPGAYIIVNGNTNNRYIGIASNIRDRFQTRLATVTEMGFSGVPTMQNIGVTWGSVYYKDTHPGPALPLVWPIPGSALAIPAPPAAFTVLIDGYPVNLEHLLIRFVLTQLGAGGTVSNNALTGIYTNPTPNPITVRLRWGDMGGLFTAGHSEAIWGIGAGNSW